MPHSIKVTPLIARVPRVLFCETNQKGYICTSSNILINKSFVILTFIVTFRLTLRFLFRIIVPSQIKDNVSLKTGPENIIYDCGLQR